MANIQTRSPHACSRVIYYTDQQHLRSARPEKHASFSSRSEQNSPRATIARIKGVRSCNSSCVDDVRLFMAGIFSKASIPIVLTDRLKDVAGYIYGQ